MATALPIDGERIAAMCRNHGVTRLRLFGSALGTRFDPERSDVDFLVEFEPHTPDLFDAYFGLREDLELLLQRSVDLVMSDAVINPYFAESALPSARKIFAA